MRQRLIQACLWMAKQLGWQEPAAPVSPLFDPVLLAATQQAVDEAERTDAGGEYKRHQVYARLLKRFPALPHWEVAYTIESVIRDRRTGA